MGDTPRDDAGEDPSEEERRLLESIAGGGTADAGGLLDAVYDELHELAGRYLGQERVDHTLQPTALIHEAWLRLEGTPGFGDRTHFFATAARAMRRVLVDHARGKRRSKRGGGWTRVELEPEVAPAGGDTLDLAALDRALVGLEAESPRQATIVELRFFAGLSVGAVAKLLDVSEGTVARDWRFARAWLARALKADA